MQDHAQHIRAKLIQATPEPIDPLASKRRQAIAYLGERHIMHPAYKMNNRHSFSVAGWQPHSILRPVQLAAQQAGRI